MVYPGNESISPEIRKRIQETFRQTLDLAEKGSRQEALLGCDFILRLDPTFESARTLSARVEAGGEVDVADLRTQFEAALSEESAAAESPAPDRPAVDLVDEEDAEDDAATGLDDLFDAPPPAESAPPGSGGAAPPTEPSADATPPVPEPPPAATTRPPAPPERPAHESATAASSAAESSGGLSPEPSVDAPPPTRAESASVSSIGAEETAEEPAAEEAKQAERADESPPPTDLSEPSIEFVAEPSVALDSETQGRIDGLLAEGQQEFDRSEYQAAIDAWSRIFLIDIDHPEANRRIELARKLKAEVERGVEEAMHEGVAALERRDTAGARAAFEKILELQPLHASARDYLDRLDSDEPPFPATEPEPAPAVGAEPAESAAEKGESTDDGSVEAPAPARPPRPRPASTPTAARTMAAGASSGISRGRRFLYLGAAVFVVVLAAAWFLWSRSSSFFPNAEEPQASTSQDPDPIARATELFEQGKQSIAIAQLRRLGPDHPNYVEAQALIFQWESGLAKPEGEENADAERTALRDDLLSQARDLAAGRRLIAAEALLVQASAIAPLEGDNAQLATEIGEQLDPIRTQIEIYQQGEWAIALRDLWRMRENGLRDPVATQLMVDCYYNLGVRDLQRGDTGSAATRFGEALELSQGDEELERLRRFAALYVERAPDLLYRIFVKYLPFR